MHRVLALRNWLILAGSLLFTQCSVLYGSPPSAQCSSDADCERQPALRGLVCDLEYGVCASQPEGSPPAAEGCETSELCTEQEGSPSLCRVRGMPCVALTTPECSRVEGRWELPNTLFIGSIGSQTLHPTDGGTVPIDWTARAMQALDLGLNEWNTQWPDGLLNSHSSLAIVHCDSGNAGPSEMERVLDHLASAVRVRAFVALGDLERNAIADRARESDISIVCAGCYERAQGAATSGVGIWRVQPPLEDQAPLVAWRALDLEQRLRAQRSLTDRAAIRVALVGQDSPGNQAFVGAVHGMLRFNGGLTVAGQSEGNYLELVTPDPTRQNIDTLSVARQVAGFRPDVLIAAMDSYVAAVYLQLIEQEWDRWPDASTSKPPRPYYILTTQNRELPLLQAIGRQSADLHLRVSGTAPFATLQVAQNRDGFAQRFVDSYLKPAGETLSAYDAFYATAYAFFVADHERQYVTAQFAYGMERLAAGPRINVGPDEILQGATYLVNGESIDLVGSSSELDWDLHSGGVSADTGLWCLTEDARGTPSLQYDAGVRWNRATGTASGTYDCP